METGSIFTALESPRRSSSVGAEKSGVGDALDPEVLANYAIERDP